MEQRPELDLPELVERVRAADPVAWATLTDRYTKLLWFIARGMRLNSEDAADAIQTTWLRLVERIDTVRQPESIGSWLATTLRHECLAALRRRSKVVVSDIWADLPDDADPLDDGLLRTEQDAALWRAFGLLKTRCQTLLRVLMADPPPSYTEVAAALDMRVGSIGPTRQRCLAALRDIMSAGSYQFDAKAIDGGGDQR
ncbi:sigma-70 family RNA polymerase sigma factor [Streptomyces sp. SID13031]|uniref:RNA polymerase sigma factor n=1 Tax=Streptomyces sp. SID13031 TaxID=2706046 RepID=UPI0013C8D235|nr:sigma-70 family RNA polymerase sigma factor [Streptomyces sp. SID13031]NEA30700.1 sigma-70 family RNA polymerase sigma factor [Streptomyces sp. SID13031]